jgi:Domain of unknown function (DUF4440)
MNTLRIMAFAFGLLILWVRCGAQVRSADSQLAELDKRLQQAVVDGRADLLEHFLAEDFTFTHGEDTKDTKAVWVARARQVPRHYLRRDVSNQVVEIHGDVGLVFGRLDTRGFPPSADPAASTARCLALEYVHTYAKRSGEWIFLSHRTTRVLEESHPCP